MQVLWEMSLNIEPRERGDERIARLLSECVPSDAESQTRADRAHKDLDSYSVVWCVRVCDLVKGFQVVYWGISFIAARYHHFYSTTLLCQALRQSDTRQTMQMSIER